MSAAAVGTGLAWRWLVFYGILSFVTQLWAGSQYSPGAGGGFVELALWSALFGVIAVAVVVERAINGNRRFTAKSTFIATILGQTVGAVIAIAWFSSKNGPQQGEWWIGPAFAAVAVTLWVHLLAPRASKGQLSGASRPQWNRQ